MSISPARAAAYDVLLRVEQEDSYASELLHSTRCAELTTADHGLATELVMGVLRWRSSLDSNIGNASSQRLEKLDPEVLIALRLGTYQLGWLDRIPARAAIHESVELVKRARKRSAVPFANAVLRRLAESLAPGKDFIDSIRSAATTAVLASASAHPEWLVQSWGTQFGLDVARDVCVYDQSIPVTALRLRTASAEAELQQAGIKLEAGALLADARRVLTGDITKTEAFMESRVAIQDEASQLVAALVGQGARILDCCAAPGGKTWAIADRNPEATIVAAELHPHRAELLRRRVSAKNVQVVTADVRALPAYEQFDRVLVDVPCSGTGTLARNPEIKWRLKPADLSDFHSRQVSILNAAMKHVTPQGRLVYSTCSLEKEEDESVVEEVLRGNESFRLRDSRAELEGLLNDRVLIAKDPASLVHGTYLRTIPGAQPCDGFFVAILERN
jgi:16S rRNA (cytosine967-C5)-methyltransferase